MGNVDIIRALVNKEGATGVHDALVALAESGTQAPFGMAYPVIHRDFLTWDEVVAFDGSGSIANLLVCGFGNGSPMGFPKLAGRTLGGMGQLAGV